MKNPLKYFIICLFPLIGFAQEDGAIQCAEAKRASFNRNLRNARIAYPGDDKIDVTYYKLNLNISYTQQYIKGEVTISFKPKEAITTCFFDLKNTLKVDSIKLAGKKITFIQESAKVNVMLDKQYPANQALSVIVYYQGRPVASAFGSFSFSTHGNGQPVIWSLSEPYGAPDWFPCKDTPADKADSSDVWVTMPKDFVSVSNGILTQVLDNQDNTRTYQWKNRYPIAQYLISIACSNYTEYRNYFKYTDKDSMLVSHFVYPEFLTAPVKAQIDQTPVMLKLFSDKFGLYPFIKEKYGHAQCGFGGGMEHQTCTSINSFGGSLVAHELAHQWFGDKITCSTWEHIWVNEGFATYSEAIYAELLGGRAGYQSNINANAVKAKRAVGSIFVKNIMSENEIFNSDRTYSKGALVVHMLRGIVGDDMFYKILKGYMASSFAYNSATTEDFQKVAEDISGLKLDYFFKEWIYGENYPKYSYGWSTTSAGDGTFAVNLTINQTRNTTPEYFSMPVDIKIVTAQGESTTTVFVDKATQTIQLPKIKGEVTQVVFDPDNKILKDVSQVQITQTPTATEPNDIIGNWTISPNPTDTQVAVEFTLKQSSSTQISVFDMAGRKVKELETEKLSVGTYTRAILLKNISAGQYLVRIGIGDKYLAKILVVR